MKWAISCNDRKQYANPTEGHKVSTLIPRLFNYLQNIDPFRDPSNWFGANLTYIRSTGEQNFILFVGKVSNVRLPNPLPLHWEYHILLILKLILCSPKVTRSEMANYLIFRVKLENMAKFIIPDLLLHWMTGRRLITFSTSTQFAASPSLV